MPYDPNDPNQGSQAPPVDQSTPEEQAKNAMTSGTINDLIRSRPAVANWLSGHNGGRNLSANEQQQLFQLLETQGIDPTHLEIDNNGNIDWPKHTVRDIALGSLLAFGPVAASWAIPAAAGAITGGGGGIVAPPAAATIPNAAGAIPAAAGAGATGAGATGAGAAAAGAGSTIPAATYGAGGVVTSFAGVAPDVAAKSSLTSDLLRYGLPTAGNVVNGIIQAVAQGKASDAQQKYLEEALAYEKEKDAGNISREAGRYADFKGNIAPYLERGNAAGSRMASLLGLGSAPPLAAGGLPGGPGGGGADAGNPLDFADKLSDADKAKVDALLQKYNVSDNPRYWYGVNAMHGGFDQTGADWNEQRISTADGAGKGYTGTPTAPATASPTGNRYGTQPVGAPSPSPADDMVTIQAPDGAQRSVPRSQLQHYLGRGATLVGQAA